MSDERNTRLLLVDRELAAVGESSFAALPTVLKRGDLVVVNDAATLPASVHAHTEAGERVEFRLLDAPDTALTRAVLLGAGDYRQKTEERTAPPALQPGDVLHVGAAQWLVAEVSPRSPRLVVLAWPGPLAQRYELIYRVGRPVQYSYRPEPLALWDVQSAFAGRPWAVEMPSAARPLGADVLAALAARGVRLVTLTHAAGLSSTGDAALDRALPLPERYEIPRATAEIVNESRRQGRRVLAVGTTVVRALEDSARRHGEVRAGAGVATLVLGPETHLRAVSGLLTGVHMPGESHHRLLQAFVDPELLSRATELMRARGYREHEFGDACLVLGGVLAAKAHAA